MSLSRVIELAEAVAAGKSSRDELAKYMSNFVEEKLCLDEHLCWSETGYTRKQVYCSENVEVVVTCFQGNQESPPHDHGGSWGMVVPYQGSISNKFFERLGDDKVRHTFMKVQKPGEVLILEKEDVHQVIANTCKDHGDRHASIHCYFPPIPTMNQFVVVEESHSAPRKK